MIQLIIVAIVVAIFAATKKIPIVCFGCETVSGAAGYMFRCMNRDSRMCEIVKEIESSPEGDEHTMGENLTMTKVVAASTFKVVSNVPAQMQTAFNEILEDLKVLGSKIRDRLSNFVTELKSWLSDIYTPLKHSAIKNYRDFYDQIIKPAKDFILQYILDPILSIIQHLMKLKKMIVDWITNTTNDVSRQMSFFKDGAIEAIVKIPSDIINNINGIISAFNNIKNDTFENVNGGIAKVVILANTMIGELNTGLSTVTTSLKGVETNVNGVIGSLNTGLGAITSSIKGVGDNMNEVIDALDDGLGSAFDGLESIVNPVIGEVNKPLAVFGQSFPELDLSGISLPPIDVNLNDISLSLPKIDLSEIQVDEIGDVTIDPPDDANKIDLDEMLDTTKNAFDFVVKPLQDEIEKAFSTDVFKPINDIISSMTVLVSTLSIKFINLFDFNFLSEELFKDLWVKLKNILNQPGVNPMEIVFDFLVKPTIPHIEGIQDDLTLAIDSIGEKLEVMFIGIADKLDVAFGTLSDVMVKFASFMTESGGYVLSWYATEFVDRIIPIPISKSKKINILLLILLLIIYTIASGYVQVGIKTIQTMNMFRTKLSPGGLVTQIAIFIIMFILFIKGIGLEQENED